MDRSGTVHRFHPIFILIFILSSSCLAFCNLMQVCQAVPSGSKSQGRVLRAQARYEAFEFTTPSRLASSFCLVLIKIRTCMEKRWKCNEMYADAGGGRGYKYDIFLISSSLIFAAKYLILLMSSWREHKRPLGCQVRVGSLGSLISGS